MSEQTKISWADSTINFWEGCTRISEGCRFCYAEARDKRFTGGKLWGKGAPRRKSKSALKDALRYKKLPWICDGCGGAFAISGGLTKCGLGDCVSRTTHRRRIFSLSLGDWLDEEVPIEWLAEMLDTIRKCSDVTWILCTKRPENFFSRLNQCRNIAIDKDGAMYPETEENANWWWLEHWITGEQPPSNIILLASVENQAAADLRIPDLLKIPAACRGLSLEPLLGPVDLKLGRYSPGAVCNLSWLVIGGESGPHARTCDVDWIRSLVEQGRWAGVAVHVKQLGAKPENVGITSGQFIQDKKAGNPEEWPIELRIQQWPEGF